MRMKASAEAALRRDSATPADLYERFLELTEPHVLLAVLDACQGNRGLAAHVLGIHRTTLRQKLQRHCIN